MYFCVYVIVHVCVYVCVYVCAASVIVRLFWCAYNCVCFCVYSCICMYAFGQMCICVCMRLYVCICACVRILKFGSRELIGLFGVNTVYYFVYILRCGVKKNIVWF